jgi:hypothetical protein
MTDKFCVCKKARPLLEQIKTVIEAARIDGRRLTNLTYSSRLACALKIVLSIGRRPCLINGHFLTSLDFDSISFHNDFADQNQAIMSYSISTLLTRNLHEVFGENDPARRRAAIDEIFTEDCVFYDPTGGLYRGATRSIASRARSRRLTLTFDISQLPSPRNWAMAGGSNGYRAAPVRRQLTPGLISSLPETAGLPPFISFSTSYPELLDSARPAAQDRIRAGENHSSPHTVQQGAPVTAADLVQKILADVNRIRRTVMAKTKMSRT